MVSRADNSEQNNNNNKKNLNFTEISLLGQKSLVCGLLMKSSHLQWVAIQDRKCSLLIPVSKT